MSDEARQHAAEQVREHLVTLRGGAPFLSPADGRLLGRWLDEATPVAAICLALERAVDARRKAPSRVPLSLTHAKRHLGKPGAAVVTGGVETTNAGHPLAPITVALRAGGDANRRELADHLEALPAGPEGSLGPDALVEKAVAAIRTFHAARWSALTDEDRRARIASAVEALGDLRGHLDEAVLWAAAEEHARDHHRQELPWLATATVWELAHGRTG